MLLFCVIFKTLDDWDISAIEPSVEAILNKAAGGVEELTVEPSVEAILNKAAEGVEVIRDKAAGGVEAVRDKAAGEIFRIEAAARHSIVFRPRWLLTKLMRSWIGPNPRTVLIPNRDLVRNPARN